MSSDNSLSDAGDADEEIAIE